MYISPDYINLQGLRMITRHCYEESMHGILVNGYGETAEARTENT